MGPKIVNNEKIQDHILNDWDKKYLIEGGKNVMLSMYEEVHSISKIKNLPNGRFFYLLYGLGFATLKFDLIFFFLISTIISLSLIVTYTISSFLTPLVIMNEATGLRILF